MVEALQSATGLQAFKGVGSVGTTVTVRRRRTVRRHLKELDHNGPPPQAKQLNNVREHDGPEECKKHQPPLQPRGELPPKSGYGNSR